LRGFSVTSEAMITTGLAVKVVGFIFDWIVVFYFEKDFEN